MTTGDLLRTLVVRWYVTLAGLALTAVACFALHAADGTFETQVDVQFLTPPDFVQDATNNPENDLVAMAGLVEQEVDPADERLEPASPDVPLSGLGLTKGSMVVLPNEDGQFDHTFRQPVLRVMAVAPSAEEAAALRDARVDEIDGALDRLQRADGVEPGMRVITRLIPPVPPVGQVAGAPDRAAAAAAVLGLVLTAVCCVAVDRLLRHRPRRRDREGSGPATTS